MEIAKWKVFGGTVKLANPLMKVDHIDMEMVVQDTASRDAMNNEMPFYFTDLQFQPGKQKTGWIPNTQEMMDRVEFDVDEWRKYSLSNGTHDPYYIWQSITPQSYPNQVRRIFNLMGRGHEVITLPNDLPEEKFWKLSLLASQGLERPVEILSAGIDFKLIPKDNYDLCRISTDVGSLLPQDQWVYKDKITAYQTLNPNGVQDYLIDNPLNYRYTREFWFSGGLEGDVLEVNASMMIAKQNGVEVPHKGVREIVTSSGDKVNLYKNKFHLIPRGSVRFRIEFYKYTNIQFIQSIAQDGTKTYITIPVLQDAGIGFGGTATFNQWTYGVERL